MDLQSQLQSCLQDSGVERRVGWLGIQHLAVPQNPPIDVELAQ